jgi:hypothetical protein
MHGILNIKIFGASIIISNTILYLVLYSSETSGSVYGTEECNLYRMFYERFLLVYEYNVIMLQKTTDFSIINRSNCFAFTSDFFVYCIKIGFCCVGLDE